MSTPIVKDSHAINSFRDSDFDAYSAYGEVIDNSIQAGATFCKIHFDCFYENKRGPQFSKINYVAFGDDGEGMDEEIIMNCLQLGYSSRYNDRKGIGRFGVGMTLGAKQECKKVEVYSKKKGGKWLYVFFDIDEMMTSESDGISKPISKDPPNELSHLISPENGTLVVWSKYDRQRGSADTIIKESHLWMGRTFRYFIWEGFEIQINKENVYAVDPLYLNLDKTKFPNDHKGEYRGEDIIDVEIPKEHQVEDGPKTSKVIIRYSLLPKHYMRHGSGNSGNHP